MFIKISISWLYAKPENVSPCSSRWYISRFWLCHQKLEHVIASSSHKLSVGIHDFEHDWFLDYQITFPLAKYKFILVLGRDPFLISFKNCFFWKLTSLTFAHSHLWLLSPMYFLAYDLLFPLYFDFLLLRILLLNLHRNTWYRLYLSIFHVTVKRQREKNINITEGRC